MRINRREFLFSSFAFALAGGCTSFMKGIRPNLRFGVVSDIHVTTPESAARFEHALRLFRDRGADAVMVPGDLADWGLKSSLKFVADAWFRVFPGDRAPDGRPVAKLFCTGNHDFEGWRYDDMALDMHANGYHEDDRMVKDGLKSCWEDVFQEPYDDIRIRTVKGYDFISVEYDARARIGEWMKTNGARFAGTKPFFFFQHLPFKGCTPDGDGWADEGRGFAALKDFPNAIAFTGHSHRPFTDERMIWQREFTVVATPSLSYLSCGKGYYENGDANRNGKATHAMPPIPFRRDMPYALGFFASVYDDHMVVERLDLESGREAAPAWVVPIGAQPGSPFDPSVRKTLIPVPQFPTGATVQTCTRNTETRDGKWVIVMTCEFPSATAAPDARAFDYEIRCVEEDDTVGSVKRFLSPNCAGPATSEPTTQRFWFSIKDLPSGKSYRLQVFPRNSFGVCGKPISSGLLQTTAYHPVPHDLN